MRSRNIQLVVPLAVGMVVAGVARAQAPAPAPSVPPGTGAVPRTAVPAADPAARRAAAPQATPGAAATALAAPDPKRMDAILDAWSHRSRTIQSLFAKFTREDVVQAWQDKTRYEGQAFLKSPDLAYLNFEKVGADGKPKPHERIICTGDRVYQFEADTKQVHVYTLAQQERQRAMEEGPLPFLFNMKADEARTRYRMRLLQENEELCLIAITPLEKVDRDAFSQAYIWLDKAKFMPTKIQLVDPNNGKDRKTFTLGLVQPNVPISDAFFDGQGQTRQVVQAAKWDVVEYNADGQVVSGQPRSADPPVPASGRRAPATAQSAQAPSEASRR